MSRPRVRVLGGAAVAVALTALGGAAIAILSTLPVADLDAAGLTWVAPTLAFVLATAAALAAIAWIVRTVRDGTGEAAATAAAVGALAGAGVVVLVGEGHPSVPLAGVAGFLLLAQLSAAASGPRLGERTHRLLALAAGLLLAQLMVTAGVLDVVAVRSDLGDPILWVAAAATAVTLLGRLVSASPAGSADAIAILLGLAALAVARDGGVEEPLGIGLLAAGGVLAAWRAWEPRLPGSAGRIDDDRLPDLAARLQDAVLRFDGRLRLADWNATAAGLLGLDPASTGSRIEDLLGIPISALPAHEAIITAERGVGGLDIALHRSGNGLTAIIRDPARAPEVERLGRELRGTVEELVQARRTIELQRVEIERTARTDPLTGLPSRVEILARLATEIAEANRYRHPVAIVLLDLDGFTRLNRIHGTAGGDAVLREVALRMRLRVRSADALGRIDGDAFLAILPHTDDGGAATFADALRRRLGARPVAIGALEVAITLSAGVATMRSGEGLDADALLARVEEALTSAKEAGGNRIALDRLHGLARLEGPDAPRAEGNGPA